VPERVPSDHSSVTTLRAHLARSGGTRRPCLRLPDAAAVEAGDVVRLLLDGVTTHARVDVDATGTLVRGAYDNERLVRSPREGDNRLVEWCDAHDREPDDAVELDELDPGSATPATGRSTTSPPGSTSRSATSRRPSGSDVHTRRVSLTSAARVRHV